MSAFEKTPHCAYKKIGWHLGQILHGQGRDFKHA